MTIAEVTWKVVLGEEEFGGGAELKARVVTVAGLFVAFSLCLSFYLLFQHLSTYNVPSVCTNFKLHFLFSFFLLSFALRESNATNSSPFLRIFYSLICVGYLQEQRWLIGVIFMVPVYAISSVTPKILCSVSAYNRLLTMPISQLLVTLNSMGLFGGQLVVPYVFPVLVLQSNYR